MKVKCNSVTCQETLCAHYDVHTHEDVCDVSFCGTTDEQVICEPVQELKLPFTIDED